MLSLRALRSLARETFPLARPSKLPISSNRYNNPQSSILTSSMFQLTPPLSSITFLSTIRPSILRLHAEVSPPPTRTSLPEPQLDILPRISSHPSLASIQVRNGPRDTFNPSHRVRKRRHGFLSRLRTRNGRKTLKRRKAKGRSTLSH